MGGDGGTIPGRADIVRTKGYGFKRNLGGMGYDPNTLVHVGDGRFSEDERRRLRFTRCFLSEDELSPPIVVDKQGNLYRKEAVLEGLLAKSLPDSVPVKKLRDVKQIVPPLIEDGPFPPWDPKSKRLQCRLTGASCEGSTVMLVSWKCGCLFSRKASEEVGGTDSCPVCGDDSSSVRVELVPSKKARLG